VTLIDQFMVHSGQNNTQVLIVGAGPAGLMMACQLARFNINFRIIDKNQSPAVYSGALIIHARSLELLHQLGIAERMVAQGIKVDAVMMCFNGKKRMRLNVEKWGRGLTSFPFMLMLEQSKTESTLLDLLAESGHRVERQTELLDFEHQQGGVAAVLKRGDQKQETVTADYLIAADGGQSTVRLKLKIPFIGTTNPSALCIMDCQSDVELARNEIFFSFSKSMSAGFFPISGNRWRIDLSFPDAEVVDHPLTFPEIRKRFRKSTPIPAQLSQPDWFSIFHSHCRYASSFRSNRCFLIGDAAHLYSPVGAQGMNSGLQDASNLAWKLASVIRGQAKAGILNSYEAERKPLAKRTSKVTNRFFKLAASEHFFFKLLRLSVLPFALKLSLPLLSKPKFGNLIFKRVSGIGINEQ
jgi:2-polyprenyl-6-methoxyphenol hydroxylase-like FAD-dependent oxidoreductase